MIGQLIADWDRMSGIERFANVVMAMVMMGGLAYYVWFVVSNHREYRESQRRQARQSRSKSVVTRRNLLPRHRERGESLARDTTASLPSAQLAPVIERAVDRLYDLMELRLTLQREAHRDAMGGARAQGEAYVRASRAWRIGSLGFLSPLIQEDACELERRAYEQYAREALELGEYEIAEGIQTVGALLQAYTTLAEVEQQAAIRSFLLGLPRDVREDLVRLRQEHDSRPRVSAPVTPAALGPGDSVASQRVEGLHDIKTSGTR